MSDHERKTEILDIFNVQLKNPTTTQLKKHLEKIDEMKNQKEVVYIKKEKINSLFKFKI